MSLLADGCPADCAYESEWDKAIDKVSEPDNPYLIGIQFLRDYLAIGYIVEIGQILSDMENKNNLELWKKAQYDIEHDLDDPNLRALRKKFCKNENCDKNVILKRLEKLAAPIFYSIQWIL